MGLIDSHAHLNFPQFRDDVEAVLSRAWASELSAIINVGTDLTTSEESVALADSDPHIFATVGVHPHDAGSLSGSLPRLQELAGHPRVVAIGEIGLDYFRNLSEPAVQQESFIAQLKLAISSGKPVVLHCRDAYEEMLETLETHYLPHLDGRLPGIVHSFATGPAIASQFTSRGFLLGINNLVTYPQNDSIREAVRVTPLTALVVETDCPFLPPQTLRGQRCEPIHVAEVAKAIAEIKGVTIDEVTVATTANLQKLFNLEIL